MILTGSCFVSSSLRLLGIDAQAYDTAYFSANLSGCQMNITCETLGKKKSARQGRDFFKGPHMFRNSRFHRGRDAEGLMNATEVVVHEVQGDSTFQVLHFLREAIGVLTPTEN